MDVIGPQLAVITGAGSGTVANDDEILAAQRLLAKTEGIFVEPAAAVGLAALIKDLEGRRVEAYEHPVLILTGAGWKDLGRVEEDTEDQPVVEASELSAHVDQWADRLGADEDA